MRKFGLIGYPLGHSFSVNYFKEKFKQEQISGVLYSNFEIQDITELTQLLGDPELEGLNVTIPHKQSVIAFLDQADRIVEETGACNCIQIKDGRLLGFNTDVIGFEKSLEEKLVGSDRAALILGTGGSSKAVAWVLKKKGIRFRRVSRDKKAGEDHLIYEDLDRATMESHSLIINSTPLGMYPHPEACPPIPYQWLGTSHYLFDLIYNPARTLFLEKGAAAGARTKNGADMLVLQAEASWSIWNAGRRGK
jgi:shikimate dehydrogenase